jgi:hypothetical protein
MDFEGFCSFFDKGQFFYLVRKLTRFESMTRSINTQKAKNFHSFTSPTFMYMYFVDFEL